MRKYDYKAKKSAGIAPSGTVATVFVDSASKPVTCYLPSGATEFVIRAKGIATGGTTTNFTPAIQTGTSTTASSNTAVTGATARAYNTASGQWIVEFRGFVDNTNSILNGLRKALNGSTATIDAEAAITAVTSFSSSAAPKPFVLTGLFSSGDTGNKSTLEDFTLEVLA